MQTLSKNRFKEIFKKQCSIINIPFSFFDPLFKNNDKMPKHWQLKHSWTKQQKRDFEDWLVNHLIKFEKMSKRDAMHLASRWIIWFGWRINERVRRNILNEVSAL